MPKQNPPHPTSPKDGGSGNLKRISIDPESFKSGGGGGGLGGLGSLGGKRRSRRRSSGLIALGMGGSGGARKTQRADKGKGIGSSLGMKKSEIMRKIRNGLLEKRRNAIASANKAVSPSAAAPLRAPIRH